MKTTISYRKLSTPSPVCQTLYPISTHYINTMLAFKSSVFVCRFANLSLPQNVRPSIDRPSHTRKSVYFCLVATVTISHHPIEHGFFTRERAKKEKQRKQNKRMGTGMANQNEMKPTKKKILFPCTFNLKIN